MTTTESDRSTIVGVFEDQAQADLAVNELRSAGFSDDQVNLEVHSAKVAGEDIPAEEQGAEAEEEYTAAEMTPGVLRGKPEVNRTVVTVQAAGREQEALAILHHNGANNANIPDALEPELAPILGAETDETSHQQKQAIDARSTDTFFSGQNTSNETGTPPSP